MDNRTKMARSFLKGITTKRAFDTLLDELFITDIERKVMVGLYEQGKSIELVASELGYSAPTIKSLHKEVLIKVSHYIYLNTHN